MSETLDDDIVRPDQSDDDTDRTTFRLAQRQSQTPAFPSEPTGFRPTAPGVMSPYDQPTAPPQPQQGMRTAPPPNTRRAPSLSDFANAKFDGPVYTYQGPTSAPASEGGFWKGARDLGRYALNDLRGWGSDLIGVGRWLNDNGNTRDPEMDQKFAGWQKTLQSDIEDTINHMSPTARNAAHASIFGSGVDANGNKIPGPFEDGAGGFATYLTQRLISVAMPVAALALLPEEAMGALAATATGMAIFGAQNMGAHYSKLADAVQAKPDAAYQKENPEYAQLRQTMSEQDAKTKVLNGTWASTLGAFAAGAASGLGFRFLGRGATRAAETTLPRAAGLGAAEGAAMGGVQGGGSEAAQQAGQKQAGLRSEYDYQTMAREAAEGATMALPAGVLAGGRHAIGRVFGKGPDQPAPTADPDEAAAAEATLNPTPPPPQQGMGTAPPPVPPGSGERPDFVPPGAPQPPPGFVPPGGGSGGGPGVPGWSPNAPPNTQIRTPVPEPGGGVPPQAPPPGAGVRPDVIPPGAPPPLSPFVPPSGGAGGPNIPGLDVSETPPPILGGGRAAPESTPAPTAAPVAARPSDGMKVGELRDALKTMPGAPDLKTLNGMGKADLATTYDRLNARPAPAEAAPEVPAAAAEQPTPSTAEPINTTVVTGADTASAPVEAPQRPAPTEVRGQPTSEGTAPPEPATTSLPPGPEGARVEPVSTTAPIAEPTPTERAPVAPAAPETPAGPPGEVAARAASKGRKKKPVVVVPEKGTGPQAYVEAPAAAETPEEARSAREQARMKNQLQQRADDERAEAVERAQEEAAEKVRTAFANATADVVPLNRNDPRIKPAITRALRDLMDGVRNGDGSLQMLSKALHDFAAAHTGDIPGTSTGWDEIAARLHREVVGEPMRGQAEAFVRGARAEAEGHTPTEHTAEAVRAERAGARADREGLSSREADAVTVDPTIARDIEAARARGEGDAETAPEIGAAAKVAGRPLSEREQVEAEAEAAKEHARQEAADRTAEEEVKDATPVVKKKTSGKAEPTDSRRRAETALKKILSGEFTPEQGDAYYGQPKAGVGNERRKGYENLATYVHGLIRHFTSPEYRADVERRIAETQKDTTKSPNAKRAATLKLQRELATNTGDHIKKLLDILGRLHDPARYAADAEESRAAEAARASKRADLEKKVQQETAARKGIQASQRTPQQGGIDPRSSRYYRLANDPRIAAGLNHYIRSTEAAGGTATLHGGLRHIANDPVVRSEMQPLRSLAIRLLHLVPDMPLHSDAREMELGLVPREYLDANGGLHYSVFGYHAADSTAETGPRRIMLAIGNEAHAPINSVVTLLHEAVHGATARYIEHLIANDPNHPHLQALDAISEELRRNIRNRGFDPGNEQESLLYALHSPHETIAQFLSDPYVHTAASEMQVSPEFRATMGRLGFSTRVRSMWEAFTNWVGKALGLDPARSASEYTLLDHVMRPLQDIAEAGSRFQRNEVLPKDPGLYANARPLYDAVQSTVSPRTRVMAERALDVARSTGMEVRPGLRRALLATMPLDRLVDRYRSRAQDGDVNHLDNIRTAAERAQVAGGKFLNEFRDRTTEVVKALRGRDDVAELMNDAGYAQASLTSSDPDANKHLTSSAQRTTLADLQSRFSALPKADQELYARTEKLLTDKHLRMREAEANGLINRAMPDAPETEKAVMRAAMKSRATLDKFLADPTNAAIDSGRRTVARLMAQVHRIGWVPGDYFPMRRYGDYVVKYDAPGTPEGYGMQMFERRADAEAARRDMAARGLNPEAVRERDSIVRERALPPSPVVDELMERIQNTTGLKDHAQELGDMLTRLRLRHASGIELGRAKRRRIAGASKDIARAIQTDLMNASLRVGSLEHGGERDAALRQFGYHADAMARAGSADAHTLDQVRHELNRQFRLGDEIGDSGASGLARRVTSFGFAHDLLSFSRLATETAEMHLKMGAFIGAKHGMGRATMELGRALKDISSALWAKGGSNTARAFLGRTLTTADYQLSKIARDRLIAAGHNKGDVNRFFDHFENNGLFDQTQAQALKELARPSNVGRAWNWFLDVTSAMSHASDESNRIAGAWAAFRADRQKGASTADAIRFAEDTLRKAPNFSPINKPRISTERGMFGKFAAPIMQFKMYGMNEGWLLANLVRDVSSRTTDPEIRKQAAYALAATIMTHSMAAGVLTWYADPARYLGGIWDLLTGHKPQDRQAMARQFLNDTFGKTAGEILGRGLPHAMGIDTHVRLGVENMLNVPALNGFTPKDFAEFAGHLALGAAGEGGGDLVSGFSKMLSGDWLGGFKQALPRIARDPVKAYDLATRGVTDTAGKTTLPASKLSPWDIAVQAAGFAPSRVTEFREGRNAVRELQQDERDEHTRLVNRWLNNPGDRANTMHEIKLYNQNPHRIGNKITLESLLKAEQQRRKDVAMPGSFGLRLPKQGARELIRAGSFANYQ